MEILDEAVAAAEYRPLHQLHSGRSLFSVIIKHRELYLSLERQTPPWRICIQKILKRQKQFNQIVRLWETKATNQ